MNESMRRNAASLMRRRMRKSRRVRRVLVALEVRDVRRAAAGAGESDLDALADNDFPLKIEVIDHGSIIEGFQKVANRIALGLVLAALIVGAAMLMQVRTTFTIFGYPGLAMLLFLAAAAGGFWMAISILVHDRHKPGLAARPLAAFQREVDIRGGLRRGHLHARGVDLGCHSLQAAPEFQRRSQHAFPGWTSLYGVQPRDQPRIEYLPSSVLTARWLNDPLSAVTSTCPRGSPETASVTIPEMSPPSGRARSIGDV